MDTAIDVRGLTRTFFVPPKGVKGIRALFARTSPIVALQDATFQIPMGQRVALIGSNGSGKSTLIKILSGIVHPTDGTARVLGHIPWERRHRYLRRLGVMFGQKSLLFPDLTLQDALDLYKTLYALSANQYAKRIEHLEECLRFTHLLNRPTRKLSLGERMRCEVVAALLHDPDLLILDEPTIGMDSETQAGLLRLLTETLRSDQTLLLTTHDAHFAQTVCSHTLSMANGKTGAHMPLNAADLGPDRVRIFIKYTAKSHSIALPPGATLVRENPNGLCIECHPKDEQDIKRRLVTDFSITELTVETAPLRSKSLGSP